MASSGPQQPRPGVIPTDPGSQPETTSQDTRASTAGNVSEVVVTAERRSESNQKVPAAISVFTDDRRNLLGIEDGKDLVNYTPSLSLNGQFLSVRGVGRYTDALGTDPGVAVYVDGIYTNSPDYLSQPDFLTDRIEVVRGPQSTYGRNSIGGSVNIISKRPTDAFYAETRAGGTQYDSVYSQSVVSGPLTDTLKARLAYNYSYQANGFQNNVAPFSSVDGNGTTRILDAQLEWKPIGPLDVWLRVQNVSQGGRPAYGQILGPYQSGSLGNYDGLVANPQYGLAPNSNPALRNAFDVNLNNPGYVDTKNDNTVTLHADYDLGGMKVRYVGGYSHYDFTEQTDADYTSRTSFGYPATGAPLVTIPSNYVLNTTLAKSYYSHEVNVSSDNDSAFKWVVGVYYYWEHNVAPYAVSDVDQAYFATPIFETPPYPPAAANPSRAYYAQTTALRSTSEAVYGQGDYDLNSKLRLTLSARYNWDQKEGSNTYRYVFDNLLAGSPGSAGDVTPPGAAQDVRDSWSDWTGKIGAEYKPNATTLAYISATKGYKSGGLDLGNFTPIPVVKPESLYAYEVGVKEVPNRSLLVDANFYFYDYHNLQVPITVSSATTSGTAALITPTLTNAQRALTYGFELESIWSPLPDLHLTLTYSYIHARFDSFTNQLFTGGGLVDTATGKVYANLNGGTLPQAPENKVAFIPQYVLHVPGGDLSLSSNLAYVGSQYYAVFTSPNYRAPSYYNLDLRAVYQPSKGHLTVIAYARNVTNQVQINNYAAGGSGLASQIVYYTNAPRVWGGELQYRF